MSEDIGEAIIYGCILTALLILYVSAVTTLSAARDACRAIERIATQMEKDGAK